MQLSEPKALILLLTIPLVIGLGILSIRARPRDRGRIGAGTLVRSLILALITFALAGLQWVSATGPLSVVFLVDQSASVSQATHDAAVRYVQSALQAMGPDDRAGVVLFGERAVVARAISGDRDWQPFGADALRADALREMPATTATNIADAIQAGLALFPEGGSRRLVLLSDGAETVGGAVEQARLAGQAGVQLSVVPLGIESRNEVAIDRVISPETIPAGQQFDIRVLVKSTSERTATVSLFDNEQPVAELSPFGQADVQLKAGDNVVTFTVNPGTEGFHVFKARVVSVDDRHAENNEASSFTLLRKPPTVLIVAGSPADGLPLKEALTASRVDAEVVAPAAMPREEENLTRYDAVVLANASAEAVGVEGQQALQRFVRDLGHGLVMLGGDLSYGAGGYLRTPIEEVLPVSMDVRTSEQRASLAMTFVTDKSGSMGRCHCGGALQFNPAMRTEYGVSKVEFAKQAIAKAAAVLNSSDQVGVVGFDATSHWLVGMQEMGNLAQGRLEDLLRPVAAEGNTNLYAGLQAAVDELKQTDAKLKHIILLSDGWTRQGDFTALLNDMDAQNITLSTVGAGEGAATLMKELADKGGGRYYAAEDVKTIPDVFLKETVRVAGSYYVEQPFKPFVFKTSPILKGLDPTGLPSLLGYNGSTLKPNAELIIKSPQGDPILAQWQYGLGRSVAWTPDVKGRWATDWVKWPRFSKFAGQIIGWTLPREVSPGIETSFALAGASAVGSQQRQDVTVRITSEDSGGAPRNFLSTSVTISSTQATGTAVPANVTMTQQSPGVYGGVVKGLDQGVYQVKVEQRDPTGALVASQVTGLVVPYPSEYRLSAGSAQAAQALLSDIAQLGGGKQLDMARPEAAFTHDIVSQPKPVPLWPWLLAAAIVLFPLDVAVRRLTLSRADLRMARAILRGRVGSRKSET
jgi:Ca-activated chloride channel homolog